MENLTIISPFFKFKSHSAFTLSILFDNKLVFSRDTSCACFTPGSPRRSDGGPSGEDLPYRLPEVPKQDPPDLGARGLEQVHGVTFFFLLIFTCEYFIC